MTLKIISKFWATDEKPSPPAGKLEMSAGSRLPNRKAGKYTFVLMVQRSYRNNDVEIFSEDILDALMSMAANRPGL